LPKFLEACHRSSLVELGWATLGWHFKAKRSHARLMTFLSRHEGSLEFNPNATKGSLEFKSCSASVVVIGEETIRRCCCCGWLFANENGDILASLLWAN